MIQNRLTTVLNMNIEVCSSPHTKRYKSHNYLPIHNEEIKCEIASNNPQKNDSFKEPNKLDSIQMHTSEDLKVSLAYSYL